MVILTGLSLAIDLGARERPATLKNYVSVKMRLFHKGGHGLGLGRNVDETDYLSLELVFELCCTSLFVTNSHGRFAHRFLKPIRENP